MEYKLIRHISSRTQNFIDSSHIFTNVKKEHLLPEYHGGWLAGKCLNHPHIIKNTHIWTKLASAANILFQILVSSHMQKPNLSFQKLS